MSFDLSALDTATPAEAGKKMILYKPGTKDPFLNDVGAEIYITLRGRLSRSASDADRKIQISRLDRQKKQVILDTEQILVTAEQETITLLTACTAEWNFDQLDGVPFPCTPENARKLWSDQRFKKIREEAITFLNQDSNFLGN